MAAPPLPLRPATAADAPRIAALVNAAFAVERFFVEGDRTSAAEIASMMGRGSFLLAEDEDRLVGCVYVEPRGESAYLGLLSVDPARQAKGLGRWLVGAAEEHGRRAGARRMEMLIVNLRTELPPFYRRLGYAESGSAPFPDNGRATQPCHFIRMSKPLDAPAG
jgi:predicted N-acetyltransferase YhbS